MATVSGKVKAYPNSNKAVTKDKIRRNFFEPGNGLEKRRQKKQLARSNKVLIGIR